jgi:hypothetical protein
MNITQEGDDYKDFLLRQKIEKEKKEIAIDFGTFMAKEFGLPPLSMRNIYEQFLKSKK